MNRESFKIIVVPLTTDNHVDKFRSITINVITVIIGNQQSMIAAAKNWVYLTGY
jgi:hypothetical protein